MSGTLPPGFTLDAPQASAPPAASPAPPSATAPAPAGAAPAAAPAALPPGFTLDATPSGGETGAAPGSDPSSLGLRPAASGTQPTQAAGGPDPAALGLTPAPAEQPAASTPKQGNWLDSAVREAAQIPSFGLADKFAAGMDALTQPVLGRGSAAPTIAQRYSDDLTQQRAQTAADPTSAKVVGNAAGLVGAVASDAPGLVLQGASRAATAIPGVNALLHVAAPVTDAVGSAVENTLARLPGASVAAPLVRSAATNALIGGATGAADADGGVDAHVQGAKEGALVGAGLGVAGTAVAKVAQPVLRLGRAVYADLGGGTRAALADASGAPVSAPVTGSQADKAAAIVNKFAADPAAAKAALDAQAADPNPVPGFQPTSYQVTGDTGLGQLEQGVKVGNQQPFVDRATQQNTALVQAVDAKAPQAADAYTVQPALQAQVDAADTAGQAQVAQAAAARDQAAAQLPTTDATTPDAAGAALRQQVEQAQAPVIAQADQRVQQATQAAQDATQAVGGVAPGGDVTTGLQDIGSQFRQTLSDANSAAGARVGGLYDQAEQDGNLALDVTPLKQASADITGSVSASAKPISGEEADIHALIGEYPTVQSLAEVRDLSSRIGDEIALQRGPNGNPRVVGRLSQLQSALQDNIEQAAANGGAAPTAAADAGVASQAAAAPSWEADLAASRQQWYADRNAGQSAATGSGGGAPSGGGYAAGGQGRIPTARDGQSPSGGQPGSVQSPQSLQPNLNPEGLTALRTANAAHRERMETFTRAPGVGDVLAEHPAGRGGFKLADSQVPGLLFSGGPKAAERVQAAIKAGIAPPDLARYAGFALRRAAENPDGTLDPGKYATWMNGNREAFSALANQHAPIASMFANADQAARTLGVVRSERAAIDAANPIKPGWSDAEVAQQAVQRGNTGRNRVQTMLANAGNTDQAKAAIQDVLTHRYQQEVVKDGEIDQGAHDRFVKAYGGALSAVPDLAAKFRTVAGAQQAVDDASAAHVQAVTDLQKGAARYFLGGGEPADRIGQALADTNRVSNMRSLVQLTANDPTARDGLKRATIDYMQKHLLSQTTNGPAGERLIKPELMMRFINEKGAALRELFSPAEMDGFSKVADAVNTMNQSVRNISPKGGSDTVYKAASALKAGGSSILVGALKDHAAELVGGVTGAKVGLAVTGGSPFGAIAGGAIGTIGGKVVHALRQANIRSTESLVTEALLNPGLMRVLLSRPTPANRQNIERAWVGTLKRLAVVQAAQASAGGAQNGPAS